MLFSIDGKYRIPLYLFLLKVKDAAPIDMDFVMSYFTQDVIEILEMTNQYCRRNEIVTFRNNFWKNVFVVVLYTLC